MYVRNRGFGGIQAYPLCSAGATASGYCFAPAVADPATAQAACGMVNGTWDSSNGGCILNVGPPNAPIGVTPAQLAAYGNYTAYQTAQLAQGQYTPPGSTGPAPVGIDAAAALVAENLAASQGLVDQAMQDCAYAAAVNYPTLSGALSPTIAAMLTNPFGTCTLASGVPPWLLYAGLAAFGLLLLGVRR